MRRLEDSTLTLDHEWYVGSYIPRRHEIESTAPVQSLVFDLLSWKNRRGDISLRRRAKGRLSMNDVFLVVVRFW